MLKVNHGLLFLGVQLTVIVATKSTCFFTFIYGGTLPPAINTGAYMSCLLRLVFIAVKKQQKYWERLKWAAFDRSAWQLKCDCTVVFCLGAILKVTCICCALIFH